ncbi:cation diffusion facilitator family transporter [Paroceanicella profunda]|uniref:cation diffusion facilitator family transporter n=1 Tax=Paroceanicella profunda TaxID=2579971 RepID=UPI003211BFAA
MTVAGVLVVLKFLALTATGSLSIAASLTDSALDLLVSSTGLLAITYAARPPDRDHAFGHSSAEDLMALAQALLVGGSGVFIGWSAVERLRGPAQELTSETAGIAVMLVSIVLTVALIWWQRRVARRTGSKVVSADSLHYVGDLVPNIGALVALLASRHLGMGRVDSIVALGAAAILLLGAVRIGRAAWDALMDRGADPQLVHRVRGIVENWPGVHGHHDLKTRMAGTRVFIQVHIELDGRQSLAQAHDIGAALRRSIIRAVPNAEVIIHKDVAGRGPH